MLREWVAKFNKSLSKRSSSTRRELCVPIKLTFEADRNTGSLSMASRNLSMMGETRDFSATGVSFQVDSIRLDELYLVGEGRKLNAEFSLPSGKVKMMLLGNRYEQTDLHLSVSRYCVGAEILEMTAQDRGRYQEFIEGKKEKGGALHLEVEKG